MAFKVNDLKQMNHHLPPKGINWSAIDWDNLSPEERFQFEHAKIHDEHRGHEGMHAEMLLILIVTLVVAQVLLVEWKKRHISSYQMVSLVAMWVIPLVISIRSAWWRFVFTWFLFSCVTSLVMRKAMQKPVSQTTPRLVYKWFYFLYKLSYALGIIGYLVVVATLCGINLLFGSKPNTWMDAGLLFIFYGLYYGVLGRDMAEICADKMACHIGYYTPQGMPTRHLDANMCAVCGNPLLSSAGQDAILEKTYRLNCKHEFHEFCIRGWCIVGKRQTCPYCKEKVDLKRMIRNPWEKPHLLYGQLLDWIRWLVAWQPVLIMFAQGINWMLGLY